MCLKVSENTFWAIFVSKRFDAGKILFILEKWISRNVSWLTELNSQRDALESVRNVYLQGKVCQVATGSNLRANVAKNQTFSKYCGNSSKINSAHILMLGRP